MSTPPGPGDPTPPVPQRRPTGSSDGSGSGGTPVATVPPAATTPPAQQGRPGAPGQPAQADPTAPLQDDSSRIDSALGTSSGAPQLGTPVQQSAETTRYLDHHQFSKDNEKDFYNFTEDDYKHNQQFATKAHAKDAYSLMNDGFDTGVDGISENDRARIVAGVMDPAKLAAATKRHKDSASDLQRYAQQISGGDPKAVATADQLLELGEPGLQFFTWFYRAYHLYTGGGETVDQLEKSYHAEDGLSFSDYLDDAALMTTMSQSVDDQAWKLNSASTTLQSSWQGQAAANFGAKMGVFLTAATTVKQDLSVVGTDISALVQGLQELVIAKAQAVNQLFIAQLPDRIDGGMAYTFAKVAMGNAEDPERRVVLGLLGMDMTGRHEFWNGDAGNDWSSGDCLNDDSRRASEQAAADWCNEVLVPEYEARQNALNAIVKKTTELIQKGFAAFTAQLQNIADPFAGMDSAHGTAPAGSGGGGGGGGGGSPAPTIPTMPSGNPTLPAGLTTPQGTPPLSQLPGTAGQPGTALPGADPTGTTRPSGLPPGATWIPSGVPLPNGWSQDPTTGEALPHGWSVDPTTGLPTAPAGMTGGDPTGPGHPRIDPTRDIHDNRDGSVSLGRDRGLTISPEHGPKGVFTLRDTDADGITHTYRVHFDEHGNPVVTEAMPHDGPAGVDTSELTDPASTVPADAGAGAGFAGSGGGGGVGGIGGGSIAGGVGGGDLAGVGAHAHHGGAQLADGTHVGADNTTANSMSGTDSAASGSPVAGSAGDQHGGSPGGGFGGVPMGGGMGGARGAGGQEQESARRYPQRGDIVGEDELEQWQRMGPVIGEQ